MTDPLPCPFCGDPMELWDQDTHARHINTDGKCPIRNHAVQIDLWNTRAPVKVKPLKWREIDPGHRYIGTGLGFTCEVRSLHKGTWEVVRSLYIGEFPTKDAAIGEAEAAYAEMVRAHLGAG